MFTFGLLALWWRLAKIQLNTRTKWIGYLSTRFFFRSFSTFIHSIFVNNFCVLPVAVWELFDRRAQARDDDKNHSKLARAHTHTHNKKKIKRMSLLSFDQYLFYKPIERRGCRAEVQVKFVRTMWNIHLLDDGGTLCPCPWRWMWIKNWEFVICHNVFNTFRLFSFLFFTKLKSKSILTHFVF